MKIDRINYQKTFNLGNYTSERIGVEAQLDDGDIAKDCLNELKANVEKLFKDNSPQLVGDGGYKISDIEGFQPMLNSLQKQPLQSVDYKAKDDLEKKIDDAKNDEELMLLVDDIKKFGLLEQHYTKLEQLRPDLFRPFVPEGINNQSLQK